MRSYLPQKKTGGNTTPASATLGRTPVQGKIDVKIALTRGLTT